MLPYSHQASAPLQDGWSQGTEPLRSGWAYPALDPRLFVRRPDIHSPGIPAKAGSWLEPRTGWDQQLGFNTKKWGTEPPIPHELMQSPCRDKTTLESMENPVVSLITECVSADLLKGQSVQGQAAGSVAPGSARMAVRMATGAMPIKTPREAPVQLSTTKTRLIPLNNFF